MALFEDGIPIQLVTFRVIQNGGVTEHCVEQPLFHFSIS